MNKTELIRAMAQRTGLSIKDTEATMGAFADVVTEELSKGEKVQIVGFGTFEVTRRAARMGRNPVTHESMEIPARTIPKFAAGKALKDAVASNKL